MKSIWKYELSFTDEQDVKMPVGAKILCVQTQGSVPCIWAIVDTSKSKDQYELRKFIIHGTGHVCICEHHEYIGTFQLNNGSLVFHLFEKGKK